MAETRNPSVGNIVRLKSGSPEMTVTQVIEAGADDLELLKRLGMADASSQPGLRYVCTWFVGAKAFEREFPEASLEVVR